MAKKPWKKSPEFLSVINGIVLLHRLIREGKDETIEADRIRDMLDHPLKMLSNEERTRAQWLSEDLYSISESPKTSNAKETNQQDRQILFEAFLARDNGDWDRALFLLREVKDCVNPSEMSFLRWTIWNEAGYPVVAIEFLRHASESMPGVPAFSLNYLLALRDFDRANAVKVASRIVDNAEKLDPSLVAIAAHILMHEFMSSQHSSKIEKCQYLSPILQVNLERLETEEYAAFRAPAYAMTIQLLGICYELHGDPQIAIQYYSRGLELDPQNDGLLVARGILQYGVSEQAIEDMEKARMLDSPLIWAYVFLAHFYLAKGEYTLCIRVCDDGLQKQGPNSAKSQLEEWKGIAQAERGFPPNVVRMSFENSIRLDPTNDTVAKNREAYETALKLSSISAHPKWVQRSNSAMRQTGFAQFASFLGA